jgi:hypothetical protein
MIGKHTVGFDAGVTLKRKNERLRFVIAAVGDTAASAEVPNVRRTGIPPK